jgi:putative copper resistance protein D
VPQPEWRAIAAEVTARFSGLGVISVVVLLATGLLNTWFLVGSPLALVGTTYGQLLLGKLGLFLAMVTLAATTGSG